MIYNIIPTYSISLEQKIYFIQLKKYVFLIFQVSKINKIEYIENVFISDMLNINLEYS